MASTTWTQDAGMDSDTTASEVQSFLDQAEQAKTDAEAYAADASQARTLAEQAQAAAENAETGSVAARNASQAAETAAAAAQTASENARDAAQTAQSAAESAETAAAASEAAAGNSETAAAASESAAAASASAAATSESNAAAAFDSFDDRYLGSKVSAPATDNDGDPLVEGALYWNSTSNNLFIWDGASWAAAAFDTANPSFSSANVTGNVTVGGTVDGRNVGADGSKLDGIEAGADVTDTANVTAAGALMDSELTSEAAVKALDQGVSTTDSPSFAGVTTDEASLAALAQTKSETAVDVFVYDTSLDSDGGAWRHRCQHTSWYNEPLNTATRGARREFPAVAVIVAEDNKVTIYDGDDPSLPMWMVFLENIRNFIPRYGGDSGVGAVAVLNGVLSIAKNGFDGLSIIDFISDTAKTIGNTRDLYWNRPISLRNANSNTETAVPGGSIVNDAVNDVAMTVLPDAPVDPATGLPVPTIAVATDGGTSVINNDGSVHDSTHAVQSTRVAFASDGTLYALQETSGARIYTYIDYEETDGFGLEYDYIANSPPGYLKPGQPMTAGRGREILFEAQNLGGLARVLERPDLYGQGMVLRTTTAYCTGWLPGDIKGAFLADTDDTDLVESEELTDTGFDDPLSWTVAGIATVSGSAANFPSGSTYNTDYVDQVVTLVSGQRYSVTVDITSYTSGSIRLDWVGRQTVKSSLGSGVGTYQFYFTAVASASSQFRLTASTSGFEGSVGLLSVQPVDADRSVNNNGLVINGTVTRSPVESGADLVSYSGFSSSNYLEQPYNADLDFGTGDFCVMGWLNVASADNDQFIKRIDPSNSGNGFMVVTDSGGEISFYRVTAGSNARLWEGSDINGDGWLFIVVARSSGVFSFYEGGNLVATTADTTDYTNTSANLYIGVNQDQTLSCSGSMALWRISGTAPTAEAIARIYNDEKHLFTEGAQATLAGTSDAVTALAHDSTTGLLHVGSSYGRSVFQGLRRVDQEPGAVTTAISAHNGLVVQQ